jgi:hypothetical protein
VKRFFSVLALCCGALGGAHAQDDYRINGRADLERYLEHFNSQRYAEQIKYYADDVAYSVGTLDISSPQQIADFYDDFHDYVDEHVEIAVYLQNGNEVFVVMPTRFEARRTYDKHGLRFEAGAIQEIVSFIYYELKDGKIHRIHVARYNGAAADFKR